jgi:hypothetical protein
VVTRPLPVEDFRKPGILDADDHRQPATTIGNRIANDSQFCKGSEAEISTPGWKMAAFRSKAAIRKRVDFLQTVRQQPISRLTR